MDNQLEKLKTDFISLLDKEEVESKYQTFLEKNPILIPTKPFELNHGVHFDLIFKKLQLGTPYISDFFYITKSSAEWNLVFIELEKPNAKFFNKDGTISQDLNKGLSQIQDWSAYFSIVENQLAFKKNKVIKELLSFNPTFYDNPCNFKYILVIGRRDELYSSKYKDKFRSLFTPNSYIMTYDSLYESLNKKEDHYMCHIADDSLYIDTDRYIDDRIFGWLSCNNIKIKNNLYNELANKNAGYNANNVIHKYSKIPPQKLEILKNNMYK